MLVSFTLKNFRSLKEPAMLSLLPVRRLTGEEQLNGTHLIETGHPDIKRLLKSAAIYGANASGKSNLLKGLAEMREFVLNNLRDIRPQRNFHISPFAFSDETVNAPTLMEVQTLQDSRLYRYGFEITANEVIAEWLYRDEEPMFVREGREFDLEPSFKEGDGKEEQTRDDALFLSVCHSYNGPVSRKIVKDFFEKIHVPTNNGWELSGQPRDRYLDNEQIGERLRKLASVADPGITEFKRRYLGGGKGELLEPFTFDVFHACESAHNRLDINELSAGTLKWLDSTGIILDAMMNGGLVVIDEIDIQLHPHLIDAMLGFFHSDFQHKAQLIFTSHNTYPLRQKKLRRDQIWFVDKRSDLSSHLTNFSEFKVRPDASYEKDYLNGRYGGIPLIDMPEILAAYEEELVPGVKP